MSKIRHRHVTLVYSKLLELALRTIVLSVKRKVRLLWGEQMTVIYPEPGAMGIARYGFYSEGVSSLLLGHLKPGMTFIDVGAHIGYFTLLAAWLVGDTGQVHSFEPTPTTFECLSLNAGYKTNVHLNQMAVTSSPGMVTLNTFIPRFSGNNSIYQFEVRKAFRPNQLTNVQSTSIDEYVNQNTLSPSLIKIDAEGADYEILKGMEVTLSRYKPVLSVEVGDRNIEGVPSSKALVLFLLEKGYQPYEYLNGSFVKHDLRDRYGYADLFFLPES